MPEWFHEHRRVSHHLDVGIPSLNPLPDEGLGFRVQGCLSGVCIATRPFLTLQTAGKASPSESA